MYSIIQDTGSRKCNRERTWPIRNENIPKRCPSVKGRIMKGLGLHWVSHWEGTVGAEEKSKPI